MEFFLAAGPIPVGWKFALRLPASHLGFADSIRSTDQQ
jgi:hypothetical protein